MATTHASHTSDLHSPALHPSGPRTAEAAARRRLRAVGSPGAAAPAPVERLLPPGATWLPVPPQSVPSLPGQPPMVGYLVLVPADRQPPFLREAAAPAAPPFAHPLAPPFAPPAVQDVPIPADGATGEDAVNAVTDEDAGDAATAELIRVDVPRRTAEVAGQPLDLTYLEFELLAHLVAHPHRVHTRDQLVATVWGYGHIGDGRTVDVHVARLRRKLGEHRQAITTVRRVGYKYTPPLAD
ncbi:winged helix-turn-helix domain-containing protein [Streptomyces fragilis]|uniref:Winged helix-turn-helix domain-containing protein n=1 Tax=Streptomyces fragilis TaxID=67301 RepID=A0ABV2YAK8_9ACTN|nr:winged helix-turn-helix domain-containing protein [Streptomyces fragilis]